MARSHEGESNGDSKSLEKEKAAKVPGVLSGVRPETGYGKKCDAVLFFPGRATRGRGVCFFVVPS